MDPSVGTSMPPQSQLRWACAELARRLRAGDDVRCEQWFDALPGLAHDPDLAVELIYTEYCTREELGQSPAVEEFCQRFPRWRGALERQFEIHQLLEGGESLAPLGGIPAEGAPSERVGPFVLLREVGRGGMGVVFEARHATLGRVVALKMVGAQGQRREALLERLHAEAQTVATLRHPNIVQLYEIGTTDDGRTFLAFEFMEAGSLAARIAGKPQDPRYAARILQQLAEAVAAAHRAGVVHCDLTPGNILFTSDGAPKIADFGLARLARGDGDSNAALHLAGTPSYMAPEQIDEPQAVGPAADVYSLGAVLYEMLTGRPPLLAATPMETLVQVRGVEPVSPKQLRPSLPRDLVTICLKCLEKDARRRYATAAALAEDLRRFLSGEPIQARSVGALERTWKWSRRHPALAVASGVAVMALALLVAGGWWYNVRLQSALDTNQRQRDDLRVELDRSARNLYTMQLMQVEQLLGRNPAQAAVMLDDEARCPPHLRDFAWGMFRRRATQDRLTLRGHQAAVLAAGPSSDGLSVVSVGADRTVRWFDSSTGRETRQLRFEIDAIGAVALSAGGKRLAVGDGLGVVRIWNLDRPDQPPRELDPLASEIVSLAWSPDGLRLAAGSGDGELRCWTADDRFFNEGESNGRRDAETASWSEVASDLGGVLSLAFSSDGQALASGGADGVVRLWTAADGTPRGALPGHAGGAKAIVFSPDGKHLAASAAWDPRIDWWQLEPREKLQSIDTHGQPARALAASRDGRMLVAALADDSLHVYRLPELGESLAYRGHTGLIHQLAVDATNTVLISASSDGTLKLWDLLRPPAPTIVAADPLKTLAVAWSSDGKQLALAGHEGTIRIVDAVEQRELARLAGHSGAVRVLRFSGDNRSLLSASEDGALYLWSLQRQAPRWKVIHPAPVLDARIEEKSREIVTLAGDGRLRRCRWDDGALVREQVLIEEAFVLAALSPDGDCAAFTTTSGKVHIWRDGQLSPLPFDGVQTATAIALSDDLHTLALATRDHQIAILDVGNAAELKNQPRHLLVGHTQPATSLVFSPDGRTLFSGAGSTGLFDGGEVKLWDLASGQVHGTLPGYNGPVTVDPQGKVLAVTERSGKSVALWYSAVGSGGAGVME